MEKVLTQSQLDEWVSQATTKKNIFGTVLRVEKGDGSLALTNGAGNIEVDAPYFIASVTKLYVTTVMLKLRTENRVRLADKISEYLSPDIMNGLHVLNGVDYASDITVKHLMSNTSGIPDYFTSAHIRKLVRGNDQVWSLEKSLADVKRRKPKFKPGQKGKAHYSDTNYQLLGKIIETITGKRVEDVFREYIFDALHLQKTYVYKDITDTRPVPIYYKSKQIHLPIYMSSITAEGGIVSTAKETMLFLKAFFGGRFFPKEDLTELQNWRLLFGPGLFFYGIGISRQPLTISDFQGLIGHWGQTGAFAFYHPKTDLYFTGTVNQFTGHGVAARLMAKITQLYKAHPTAV